MRAQRASKPPVTVRSPAKVNLHLGVGAPRPDGFHPLATVYQAIGLYDDVTVTEAPDWSVALTEPVAGVPLDGDNIAVRAGRALAAHHGLDRAAAIEISKGIPVAGGMAGGSADAAATLVALDRLWDLQTPDDDLLALAAGLGSDVPFALVGGTATGLGRGELVTPVPDAGEWWWVVVPHDEGLSTPAVYRRFDELCPDADVEPAIPTALLDALADGDVRRLAGMLANDLQEPALSLRPELRRTFDDGGEAGVLATLLSGSGPTVLLLCETQQHAHAVHQEMTARGHERLVVAAAPVAGAHVVTYG